MPEPRRRVVILSTFPETVETLASRLLSLGHDPVAAVGPRRKVVDPKRPALDGERPPRGIDVVMADSADALAPVLRSLTPDLLLCWGFPWRVPAEALEVPALGAINYHPSLLPRHRGINPLGWTIRMGDDRTGVTWHRMDPHFDQGPIMAQQAVPLDARDTVERVILRLTHLALRLLPKVMEGMDRREPGSPQPDEGATVAGPFGEDYATIDWSRSARSIHDQVRAWAFAAGTGSVVGPRAVLDGENVRVVRTTLDDEGRGTRMECSDGPIWILATEPCV